MVIACERTMAPTKNSHFERDRFIILITIIFTTNTPKTIKIWANSTPIAKERRELPTDSSGMSKLKYRPKPKPWITPKSIVKIGKNQEVLSAMEVLFLSNKEIALIAIVTGINNSIQ